MKQCNFFEQDFDLDEKEDLSSVLVLMFVLENVTLGLDSLNGDLFL